MEHVYTAFRRASSLLPNAEWRERPLKCSLSCRNALAFTADSLDGGGGTRSGGVGSTGHRVLSFCVYVADLNTPWDPALVMRHVEEITCLEWDSSGSRLMIGDAAGSILIYRMQNYLLNEWVLVSTTCFPGEHLIAGAWFHSGKKVAVSPEKKESPLYLEKYVHLKFGPSMRRMGGKPCDGCIAVSASGLVCVVLLPLGNNINNGLLMPCAGYGGSVAGGSSSTFGANITVESESGITGATSMTSSSTLVSSASQPLTQFRHRLQLADLCYCKNGDFLVVTSDGLVASAVHCFRVALRVNHDRCQISCQPFSSFYLNAAGVNLHRHQQQQQNSSHQQQQVVGGAPSVGTCPSGVGGGSSVSGNSTVGPNTSGVGNVSAVNSEDAQGGAIPGSGLSGSQSPYQRVTHLRFILREGADGVVVSVSDGSRQTQSIIELWELVEKTVIFHPALLGSPPSNPSSGPIVSEPATNCTGGVTSASAANTAAGSSLNSSASVTPGGPSGGGAVSNAPTATPMNVDPNVAKTVGWQLHAVSGPHPSAVSALATLRLCLFDVSPPPSYIVVAFRDASVRCFIRDKLSCVASASTMPGASGTGGSGGLVHPHHVVHHHVHHHSSHHLHHHHHHHGHHHHHHHHHMLKAGPTQPLLHQQALGGGHHGGGAAGAGQHQLADLCVSTSGCVVVAVDSLSQPLLFRLSPIIDPGGPMSVSYAATVLEYCLIAGIDWWDVLVSLRPGVIEKVCERLCDTFTKQPSGVQQYLHSRFLALKASLFRLLNSGQAKAGDCHAQMMLSAVSTSLKALLRPRETKPDGSSPTDALAALIYDPQQVTHSIEKILVSLDNKEFFVEPAILPSVQHHVQWVCDLALHIMASLPLQVYQRQRFSGGGLIGNARSINMIRELLVIFRIWGLISESCLPTYTRTTDNVDVLGLLFRLLTKTLLNYGSEPDPSLIDECSLLPSQILIPALELGGSNSSRPPEGVLGPALFIQALPVAVELGGSLPDFVRAHQVRAAPIVEGCVRAASPAGHVDVVRHISLGKHCALNVRKCTRCFSLSMLRSSAPPPGSPVLSPHLNNAMRAWEQRWLRCCPCGGQWILSQ